MEQRQFGNSGLSVSVLSFGTMTIGGRDRFGKMGNLGVPETVRILELGSAKGDACLEFFVELAPLRIDRCIFIEASMHGARKQHDDTGRKGIE